MNWFFKLNLACQIGLIYFIIINIITFFSFGLDKIKSQLNYRRISEGTLFFLSFVGGSIGASAGMVFFRHKTKKSSFQVILALILFFQISFIIYLFSIL